MSATEARAGTTNMNGDGAGEVFSPEAAAIRRILLEEPQKLEELDDIPLREELPGSAQMLHRAQAALGFSERGHGKSTVAKVLGLSVAAHGGRVFYWDRENGAALMRGKCEGILDAHPEWGDPIGEGRFVGRIYPRLDRAWKPTAFCEALAGFDLVIYDSLREAISQLGGDSNLEADISRWIDLCVTPLLAQGTAVFVLDNTGHEAQHRPKGSASKLDGIPQAYRIVCLQKFTAVERGRLDLSCTRSRSGDMDRQWSMEVGGGIFELPQPLSDNPDELARRQRQIIRESFRKIALEEIARHEPIGRDNLLGRIRERGVSVADKTGRAWLREDAERPDVPFTSTDAGYVLEVR